MSTQTPFPLLYRVRLLEPAPTPSAPWAITVQCGEDDPAPRVLAYARAAHIAERICRALRQSDRIAAVDNATAAAAFAARGDTRGSADDA